MPTEIIPSDQISVVIQGPLYLDLAPERGIFSCIQSIKKHLPDAEIIISTWKSQPDFKVDGCRVIRSDEPENFRDPITGNVNNINRQITSTRAGIIAASRSYVLKFRADHCLTSQAMTTLSLYSLHVPSQRRQFHAPVTVTNMIIRNPVRIPMLFHLSDLVQFGHRDDLLKLWSLPLLTKEQAFRPLNAFRNPFGNFMDGNNRYEVPEQSLALGLIRGQGDTIQLKHACHVTYALLEKWERLLIENFTVLDWPQAGIDFPPRFFLPGNFVSSTYTPSEIAALTPILGTWRYRLRFCQVLLNQYLFRCFQKDWVYLTLIRLLKATSPFVFQKMRDIKLRVCLSRNEKSTHISKKCI
jgi:hypothetical protein